MTLTPQRIINKRQNYGDYTLFKIFGDRYETYRNQWTKANRREIVTEFPLYLQFELTPYCNLACPSCLHGVEQLKRRYVNLKASLDFEKVLKEAVLFKCPSISFHNNNEPLLLKDLENKIVSARQKGFMDLILTTNATLLSKDRVLKILDAGLTKINFSVDAFTEETFRLNRKNANFKDVLSNILHFLEMKKKRKYDLPITRVTFLVNRNNYMEIDQFNEYWKDKVDLVEFQNFQALEGYTESLCPPGSSKYEDFECSFPWQQVVIRANGDVLPCCSLYGSDIILGNISQNSIYELWHGELITELRASLSNGTFAHPSCQKCARTFYK